MGGGSKKGGGGAPAGSTLNIPQGLYQGAASTSGLGQYGTALLNPMAAMTGWASSLATGQPVNVPGPQGYATQQGPSVLFGGTGKPWASQFDPQSGLITFTNPQDPGQTFQASLQQAQSEGADIPPAVMQQWQQAQNAYQASQAGGGGGAPLGGMYGNQLMPGITQDQVNAWYQQNYGQAPPSDATATFAFNQAWSQQTGQPVGSAGPQLEQAWNDILLQQAATQQMPGIEAQTQAAINQANVDAAKFAAQGDVQNQQAQQLFGVGYQELSDADKQIVDANALVQMTTTGQGLFPAQQAMIEQARTSEETQLASTLGGVGLGRSTQLAQMTGAADQAAAATAGQLQQGNIQAAEQVLAGALGQQTGAQRTLGLAQTQEQVAQQAYALQQASQKLSLTGVELLTSEQAQLTTELQNITTQSAAFQQQMWAQAMQGYGTMGNIISQSAQSYGYSLNAYNSILQAMEQQNQTNAGIQEAAMKADQQGTSNLLSGLGTLFGGQGIFGSVGGGSSLLGALGLGGGAAAGIGGAAAAAGAGAGVAGATGAAGVATTAAVTAVGAAI